MKENKMGKANWDNIHIRKRQQTVGANDTWIPVWKRRPRLSNYIKILLKNIHSKNYIRFNHFSFFKRYIYSIWFSQTDI